MLFDRVEANKIYIPKQGVTVMLPPKSVDDASDLEKIRVEGIAKDSIMKQRYPCSEVGSSYMKGVSQDWRAFLEVKAQEVAGDILSECQKMGRERFAVVLFGSVARGLVKCPRHVDPSNIDLAVIGEFLPEDRCEILERIRPARQQVTGAIKQEEAHSGCSCSGENCQDRFDPHQFKLPSKQIHMNGATYGDCTSFERVGVFVQCIEKASSNDYLPVRRYITASGRPLENLKDLWDEVEAIALPRVGYYNLPTQRDRNRADREHMIPGANVALN